MFDLFNLTDDRKELFAALIKAQSAMGSAVRDSKNPHFRHGYASLSAVIDAVIPVLNEAGVGILQLPSQHDNQVQLTTVLIHSSGQMVSSTVATPMDSRRNNAQGVGSAITYLRRYSLQSIMGLPVEDDDGNAASGRQTKRRQPAPPAQPAAKPLDYDELARQITSHDVTYEELFAWCDAHGRGDPARYNRGRQQQLLAWLSKGGANTVQQWAIDNALAGGEG